MHIRELVKQKWREAGLYTSRKAKIRAFLKYFDQNPTECWDTYIQALRDNYYAVFNDLILPLLDTDDKLLRLTIIRKADLRRRKELNLLRKLARECDPVPDKLELLAIAKLEHKGLSAELRKRQKLPSEVCKVLEQRPSRSKAAKS